MYRSSTQQIPDHAGPVPAHIAIVMDGNGRWAKRHHQLRMYGHKKGVDALKETVKTCQDVGVRFLTAFAFSSENWRRPESEISFLMSLFLQLLKTDLSEIVEWNIRLKVVGRRERLSATLRGLIVEAENATAANTGLTLSVAVDYGGRWDFVQAIQHMLKDKPFLATSFDEDDLSPYLMMHYAPEPDLLIRTGGEQRISNFLLWQLAYSELYFTNRLWPDFDRDALEAALEWYRHRERRFGQTREEPCVPVAAQLESVHA